MPRYKYEPLKEFLDRTPERVNTLTLTFAQLEVVIEDELPPGASQHRAGWAHDPRLARARGWLPDWRTGPVSVEEGWVTFTRVVPGGDAEVKGEAPTSSYDPLRIFLENVLPSAAEMMLGFEQIETLVGFDLPPSARKYQEWWANPGTARGHPYAQAWVAAGWRVDAVDLDAEWVHFWRSD